MYAIHWIVIYLVDRVIHLLNNWGLEFSVKYIRQEELPASQGNFWLVGEAATIA